MREKKFFVRKIYLGWVLDFSGVARYIDENNLTFENLKIEYNKYIYNSEAVFELYNLQENGEYEKISTLVVDTDDYNTREYTAVESKEFEDLREQISKKYSIEITEAAEDKNGNYIVYDENGQVFVSTEFNEIDRPDETMDFESVNELKLENVQKRIEDRTTKLKKYQDEQQIAIIIEKEMEFLEEEKEKKERIVEAIRKASRKKITPVQIESKTINGNVTVQSLQRAMEDLSTEDKNLENEGEDLNVK